MLGRKKQYPCPKNFCNKPSNLCVDQLIAEGAAVFKCTFYRAVLARESGGKADTFQLILCRWVKRFLFSHKANSAQVVSPGNSGWQFKAAAKALGDAAVPAHGVAAEQIHPERPGLGLLTDGYDKGIFASFFILISFSFYCL